MKFWNFVVTQSNIVYHHFLVHIERIGCSEKNEAYHKMAFPLGESENFGSLNQRSQEDS